MNLFPEINGGVFSSPSAENFTHTRYLTKLNDQLKQTAVLVTHDIAATMEIADYIYFMSNGEIIADGTTEEIRNSTNPAFKQFINGEISGPFEFKYPSQYSYEHYLGLK